MNEDGWDLKTLKERAFNQESELVAIRILFNDK